MVFMLGRMLWCIFETQPSANAAEFLGAEMFREADPNHRFPSFRRTPIKVQHLIYKCTIDARQWSGEKRCVERVGDWVYTSGKAPENGVVHAAVATEQETRTTLTNWWLRQREAAEGYLMKRYQDPNSCEETRRAAQRPSLEEVVRSLERCREDDTS